MLTLWQSVIIVSIFMVLVMAAAWALCIKIKNFGYLDFVWSISFSLVAVAYFFLSSGWFPRRLLFTAMVCFWSLRLAIHLFNRITAHHPIEDVRYSQLRVEWAKNLNLKMFLFFQFQALSIPLLTAPFFLVMQNATPQFSLLEIFGSNSLLPVSCRE